MDNQPRRRALPVDVAQRRQAMAALLPIHEQIGPWQAQTARLTSHAERLRGAGGHAPSLVAEAQALYEAVTHQQRLLVQTTRDLPAEIAANGRMLDTARALESLVGGIENVLALSGVRTPHGTAARD